MYVFFGSAVNSPSSESSLPVLTFDLKTYKWAELNTTRLPQLYDGISCSKWPNTFTHAGASAPLGIICSGEGRLFYLSLKTLEWKTLGSMYFDPPSDSSQSSIFSLWSSAIQTLGSGIIVSLGGGQKPIADGHDTCIPPSPPHFFVPPPGSY